MPKNAMRCSTVLIVCGLLALTARAQEAPSLLRETEVAWRNGMPESTGTLAPGFWDLTFETLAGDTLRLDAFKGRYLLLNFWGEWCPPCLDEMPLLAATYRDFPRERLEIVGMLLPFDVEAARAVVAREAMTWPQALTRDAVRSPFGVFGYPMNLLILPDGKTYLKRFLIDASFFEDFVR